MYKKNGSDLFLLRKWSWVVMLLLVAVGVAPVAETKAVTAPAKEVQIEELTMFDTQTGWALTKDRGSILFTRRGMAHWIDVTPAKVPLPPQDMFNSITASHFPDAAHGYVGLFRDGQTQLLITRDSGKHWDVKTFDFSPLTMVGIYQIRFVDDKHGWIAFDKGHGFGKFQVVLMSTQDGGKTWQQLLDTTQEDDASGLPLEGLKQFTFTSRTKGWMTGPED